MFVLTVLLTAPLYAQRIAVPRALPRAAVPTVVPSMPLLPLSFTAAHDAPKPLPPAESQSADFDALFSGRVPGAPWTVLPDSPRVLVGATQVDRRAPGARELLKTLTLPHSPPALGLFTRRDERPINGFAMGTQGIYGHKDAVPPGLDTRDYGGYSLRLRRDGGVDLVSSGHLPAVMTPRLLRNLKRYYGLSPAMETGLERLGRYWLSFWDGLSAFF